MRLWRCLLRPMVIRLQRIGDLKRALLVHGEQPYQVSRTMQPQNERAPPGRVIDLTGLGAVWETRGAMEEV